MRYFSPNLEVKKKLVGLILLLIDVLWEGKWHIFVHDWFTPTLLLVGLLKKLLLLLTQCFEIIPNVSFDFLNFGISDELLSTQM